MAERKKVAEQKEVAGRGDRVRGDIGGGEGSDGECEVLGSENGSGSGGEDERDWVGSGSEGEGEGDAVWNGNGRGGEKEISKGGSRDGDGDGDMDVDGEQDKDGDLTVEDYDLGKDGITEDGNTIDANVAGRSGNSPKRPRNDEETEPADEDTNHADKRHKTRSESGSGEGSPVEEPAAPQPHDDDAGNEIEERDDSAAPRQRKYDAGNGSDRTMKQHFLQGIRTNWGLQPDELVKDVPKHFLHSAAKKDDAVPARYLKRLFDLSAITAGGWKGEDGVQAELKEKFKKVGKHSHQAFFDAIEHMHARFTPNDGSRKGTGTGNTNPSPADMAVRRQLIKLVEKAWGMEVKEVVPDGVLKYFRDPDPLTWDTYALRRLWELGKHRARFTYASGVRHHLWKGFLDRIKLAGQTPELTAEDTYYAYSAGESLKPFKEVELPALPDTPPIIVLNAHNTCQIGFPHQPPNNGAAPPPPQHNGSAAGTVQHPQPRRQTPLIQRQIVLVQHELRVAQREQLVAEAGVEVAKARQSKAGMDHHPDGTAELNAAASAVTNAKGKVQEVKTKLIQLRETLDELHEKRDKSEKG